MATFFLFYAVERWNEWYQSFLYINKTELQPLQIYLRNVLISMSNNLSAIAKQMMRDHTQKVSSQAIQMATIVVTTIPILCVYPFVQKHFVKGVMIESYIEPGSQKIGEHCYGKSITDPCLGWDETEKLLDKIAESL